jgi:hypothetical protein
MPHGILALALGSAPLGVSQRRPPADTPRHGYIVKLFTWETLQQKL